MLAAMRRASSIGEQFGRQQVLAPPIDAGLGMV
jgi:hypothetical protein